MVFSFYYNGNLFDDTPSFCWWNYPCIGRCLFLLGGLSWLPENSQAMVWPLALIIAEFYFFLNPDTEDHGMINSVCFVTIENG